MNIVAIDFETASPDPASACAIGLAFVEKGKVVRVEERLIRPPAGIEFIFTHIHGITAHDVKDAPGFDAVWREFALDLKGAMLLAHNAEFDMGVIRGCRRAYGMKGPGSRYLCTLSIARAVWPALPSKALNNVARHLAISLNHHNAASDASAAAQIAIAAAEELGLPGIAYLPERLRLPLRRI
jgi:DNA polymerase III subunit epsilon